MRNGFKGKIILIQEVTGEALTEPHADRGLRYAITFNSEIEVDEWLKENPHNLTEKQKEHLHRATMH